MAYGTMSPATIAAAPALEPPGVKLVSQGFVVIPVRGLSPTALHPNSLVVDFPSIIAPALRNLSTEGASTSFISESVDLDPNRWGMPLTAIRSLIDVGIPSSWEILTP